MSSWLSKIRSVHTYVMPRTVYFGWICRELKLVPEVKIKKINNHSSANQIKNQLSNFPLSLEEIQ